MSEPAEAPVAPRRQAALALLLLLFFEGLLLYQYGWRRENLLHVDLPSFYFATNMALRHGQSPYGFPAMAAQAPVIGQPVFPFLHPPPTLISLAPLALVSYRAAKWAMVAMNHLLKYSGVHSARIYNQRLQDAMRPVRQYLEEDYE